jgi:hypothetical protein
MIVERKFRTDESMKSYAGNKWFLKKLKEKYDPSIYTAIIYSEQMELRIYKRSER